ncbi:MAG: hypothetical protein KIT17_28385, partial [Rubrivivax sp.]|nr:hypothetical protein [Rubrivivax sp.]
DPRREFEAWDVAMRANTRASFETFLRAYPNGRYSDRARARVAEFGAPPSAAPAAASPAAPPAPTGASRTLAEYELWDRAQTSNARADYEAYLREYPNGRYAARARAALPKAR